MTESSPAASVPIAQAWQVRKVVLLLEENSDSTVVQELALLEKVVGLILTRAFLCGVYMLFMRLSCELPPTAQSHAR